MLKMNSHKQTNKQINIVHTCLTYHITNVKSKVITSGQHSNAVDLCLFVVACARAHSKDKFQKWICHHILCHMIPKCHLSSSRPHKNGMSATFSAVHKSDQFPYNHFRVWKFESKNNKINRFSLKCWNRLQQSVDLFELVAELIFHVAT